MSTPTSPLSVQDFASRIRTKFPGSYDSIPDDELARRIVAKHPEYQDKVSLGATPTAQTTGQGQGAPATSAATPSMMPSGSDWLHAAGLPASMTEAQMTPGQALKIGATNVMHAADPTFLLRSFAGPMVKEGVRYAKGIWEHGGIPEPMDAVHLGSAFNPFAAPVVSQMSDLREKGKEGEATATGVLGAGTLALGEALPKAVGFFKPGLPETAHTILGNAATRVKQTVGQGGPVYQAVSDHFGKLTNDIAAADYASGKKIPMNDIWEKALEHADDYAAGKTTPKFNAIVDEIQKRPVELTWKELHDLQQNVDKVTSAAAEGSRDAGAANQMRSAIAKKLDAKAGEVGRGDQWNAAKTIWRSLKEYQGDGVLKKLLNTGTEPVAPGGVSEGGKQFFDVLTDPANQAKLKEINKGFEPYGLPADYFKDVAKSHAPLHDYLSLQSGAPGGVVSRFRLAIQHPGPAIPPMVAGAALGTASGIPAGGYLGGSLGALAGVRGAARARAISALSELGGAPDISSPMTEAAKVKPVGTGAKPTPPAAAPGAVNMNELTEALKSLGYKKDDAASLARMGMAEFPNDFNKALNRAMQGPQAALKAADIQKVKSVSGGSQAATSAPTPMPESGSGTYAANPRTQEQILEGIQALKEGRRALRKDK